MKCIGELIMMSIHGRWPLTSGRYQRTTVYIYTHCISILLRLPRLCVCLCAKFDQFLPVRSHFDTKRPVNFLHTTTFPSPTFGPLFAFHCPLFFTKNNNLECRDVLKTVTLTCVCAKFDQFLTNFCPYALISTPNVP